jgi:DNA-binding NarL/FixJ family response regulator
MAVDLEGLFLLHCTAILPRNPGDATLALFLTDSRLRRTPRARIASAGRALQRRCRLTRAELSIVQGAVQGRSRESIAVQRQRSPVTVKKQIHSLLGKASAEHLHELVRELLLEALFGAGRAVVDCGAKGPA